MTVPRCGVLLGAGDGDDPVAIARRAEHLGFEAFFVPDHFNAIPAPIPTLGAVAAATGLTVGSYMLANDLRHPAVVARDIATLDRLSGGRAVLGLGAGWMDIDYAAIGAAVPPFGERLERLAEAVEVIRAVWKGAPHHGVHYSADPGTTIRPVSPTGPAVIVGGGGPRMLEAAARMADVVSVGVPLNTTGRQGLLTRVANATFQDLEQRVELVRRHGGDRLDMLVFRVSTDPAEVAHAFEATPEQVTASPYLLGGTLEEIRAGIDRLAGLGFESLVVRVADMETVAAALGRVEVRR